MTDQGKDLPDPLERLLLPADLDGHHEFSRARSNVTKQVKAVNDLDAIKVWLAEFRNSPDTLRNCRGPIVVYLPAKDNGWYDTMENHKIVKYND